MIITRISGGIGNQLFQYAAGRRLAHKHNTEFKLDLTYFDNNKFRPYSLNMFNTTASIATPEEIAPLRDICLRTGLGMQKRSSIQEVWNYPDNIYLEGDWCNEVYFWDIRDILLREITLKNPLSPETEAWKQKILAAECPVSLHVRHGDFLYNPSHRNKPWFHIPPLDYYYNCIQLLKQAYGNLTVFVFSNNLGWVKQNLHLDVLTEFVEDWQDEERFNRAFKLDIEEMYLMSICKHSVNPRSAFSWWGAYLNQNPDKKIFDPVASTAENIQQYLNFLKAKQISPLDFGSWIRVPFDFNKQPDITQRPWFSLLLVVNNDIATLPETLGTILNQDYKFYEVIIIDNASFDGSGKLCQQAAKNSDKVTLIKLYEKISDGAAWNMALNAAQGNYVMFLKGNDRLVVNALSSLYMADERVIADVVIADVVNSAIWLREDANGNIVTAGKKFVLDGDAPFRNAQSIVRQKFDKQTVLRILASNPNFVPIASKIFKRKFLADNAIRFDEKISDNDAKILFTTEAMLRTNDEMLILPNVFYVAPQIV